MIAGLFCPAIFAFNLAVPENFSINVCDGGTETVEYAILEPDNEDPTAEFPVFIISVNDATTFDDVLAKVQGIPEEIIVIAFDKLPQADTLRSILDAQRLDFDRVYLITERDNQIDEIIAKNNIGVEANPDVTAFAFDCPAPLRCVRIF